MSRKLKIGIIGAGSNQYHQYYGYKSEDIDFVKSILEGRTPMCTIADAAKTMDMVEMLLSSRITLRRTDLLSLTNLANCISL